MSGAYDVSVHLRLVDALTGPMHNALLSMQRFQHTVHGLESNFAGLRSAIAGTVATMAGMATFKGLIAFEQAAEGLAHAENALSAALPLAHRGMDMQIARTTAYAEAGRNLQTSLSGNIEAIHDLYGVVQDMHHAADLLPVFNKLRTALSFTSDETKGFAGDSKQLANVARAFEMAGRTTPEAIEAISHAYIKSIIALRGRVTGGDFLQAVSGAGAARYGWTDSFMTEVLPGLANIMKGRTNAGIGLYHLSNNLWGGVSSSYAQAKLQEKWGLHSADDEERDPKTGKFQGFRVGSVWGADALAKNPLDWANALIEKWRGMGVNVDSMDVMRGVVAEVARGNKALQAILDELLLPATNRQMNKERLNIRGVEDPNLLSTDDPKVWWQALEQQSKSFKEAVGNAYVSDFVHNFLKPITLAVRDLQQWAIANPETVRNLARAFAALGAALVFIGSTAIIAGIASMLAGFGGLAFAISGAAAAIIGLTVAIALNWSRLREWAAGMSGLAKAGGLLLLMSAIANMRTLISGLAALMLANPWLALATGLAVVAVTVYQHWDEIVARTTRAIDEISEALKPLRERFFEALKPIDSAMQKAGDWLGRQLGGERTMFSPEEIREWNPGYIPPEEHPFSEMIKQMRERRRIEKEAAARLRSTAVPSSSVQAPEPQRRSPSTAPSSPTVQLKPRATSIPERVQGGAQIVNNNQRTVNAPISISQTFNITQTPATTGAIAGAVRAAGGDVGQQLRGALSDTPQ
ncbi:hypothetical protein JDN40_10580 [Rhodomicrobium vannielii ATCC 17100]|uniref:hypothetical protein n=1 Tax=Rhodomicrobium vannielii TaxID=1069 RepID=UPI001917D3AB|nr:hypothetical protein [Rhodomicrobium vannielii]MBJ7534549.1 hypothetical protein [Rhodomicrobium vannielii ATCC 17100]